MAHVTFVHGIANKIAAEHLLQGWLDALRDEDGPDLRAEGVTTSMCYWADVLHAAPLPGDSADLEAGEEAEVAAVEDVGLGWLAELPPEERAQVEELAAEADAMTFLEPDDVVQEPDDAIGEEPAGGFEGVPLPGPLKRRLMRSFLRDVHHYLWDASCTPRPGDTYRVRTEVRGRMLASLQDGAREAGPHVVLGHSLGSVIAYDVLKNVPEAPAVDRLVTVGSPLGLDEVQDRLLPGWTRRDGFPHERVTGGWFNAYDRLDPVCGLDPRLGNDFREGGTARVVDVHEPSWGSWRHSIGKYLRGPSLRTALRDALGLP